MSMASFLPARFASTLPARVSGMVRWATRRRRWLAGGLVLASAVQGTWQGIAYHQHERRVSAWWSERFAAIHGAMALANVVANLAEAPGEWSLVWLGDGRSVLRKGAVARVLPVGVTKPDGGAPGDEPLARIILSKGEGAVPVVKIAGGTRSLCFNVAGKTSSDYLGRRLELGTYDGNEWTWTPVWGPVRRLHKACDELTSPPEWEGGGLPPRLDRLSRQAVGLRIGQPSRDPDPRAR